MSEFSVEYVVSANLLEVWVRSLIIYKTLPTIFLTKLKIKTNIHFIFNCYLISFNI